MHWGGGGGGGALGKAQAPFLLAVFISGKDFSLPSPTHIWYTHKNEAPLQKN